MKKATIIFAILFIITLLVPLIAVFEANNDTTATEDTTASSANELVTIFNASILEPNYHLHF